MKGVNFFTLPAAFMLILLLASCRTVQKTSSTIKERIDSTITKKRDSTKVEKVDILTVADTDLLFSRDKRDSSSSGVIVTLDPGKGDSSGRILVEIDEPTIKAEDYLTADKEKRRKKTFTVKVPVNTRTVEIYTRDGKSERDSLSIRSRDSSRISETDSGKVSIEETSSVTKESESKTRNVDKKGLTCGGGILVILLAAAGVFWYFSRRRRR